MSDVLKPIKEHDIDSLHYRTKIAPQFIKALLKRDFSKFSKVQFLGFVSILEREFMIDLSSYKDEYFTAIDSSYEVTPEIKEFVSKKEPIVNKNRKNIIIGIVILVVIILTIIYKLSLSNSNVTKSVALDDTLIKEVKKQIEVKKQEIIVKKVELKPKDLNTTTNEKIQKIIKHKVILLPKRRLWTGFIDMQSGKKTQKVLNSAYELNVSKSWLIIFGHGYLDIEYDNELFEYSNKNKLWFIFENGKLEKINKEEFRRNNGGKGW